MQVFKQQIQKLFLSLLLFGLSLYQPIIAQRNLSDYVNTLQGTNSKFELTRGNTYPTTALPFGMNTWTPQTGTNGDGWKYQYFKETNLPYLCPHHGKWKQNLTILDLYSNH